MKKTVSLLAVLAGAHAFASYELMFATNHVNNSINRYDAITGASLGSFGAGYGAYLTTGTADKNTGTYYVGDLYSNRILKFNYSTGEFLGYFSTGSVAPFQVELLSDGSILAGYEGPSDYKRFSFGGTLLGTYSGTLGLNSMTQASNGFLYGVNSTGQVLRYNFVGGAPTVIASLPGYTYAGGIKAFGNTITVTCYQDTVTTTALSVKADGTLDKILGTIDLGSGNANLLWGRSVAYGHGGTVYTLVEDRTAFKNYVYSWVPGSNNIVRKLDLGINGDQYLSLGIATVVAPEPGTWAILGIGALVLVRRRRS
jgi:hypothetical protein